MRIEFPFGDRTVGCSIPLPKEHIHVAVAKDPPAAAEPEALTREALRKPTASLPLRDLVDSSKTICLIFDDWTRATPVARLLPPLLEELKAGGVKDEKVIFVCANGMHDPEQMTAERMTEKLGQDVFTRFKVVSHNAYDPGGLIFLGVSRTLSTPLFINQAVAAADVKIAVGTISPHGDVGYSGGAKAILPGVADVWSIIHHHTGSFPRRGLLDNRLRADIEECGTLAGLDFIVNVVCNSRGEVVRAFAGAPTQAHRKAVGFGDDEIWGAQIPGPADIVIASPGAPTEGYFMPSMRSLGIAHLCLQKSGTIIVVASCAQGWSLREYLDYGWHVPQDILQNDYAQLWRLMVSRAWHEPRRQFQALVYFVQHVAKTCAEKRVRMVGATILSEDEAKRLNLSVYKDLGKAVQDAVYEQGDGARVLIVSDCFTVPLLARRIRRDDQPEQGRFHDDPVPTET